MSKLKAYRFQHFLELLLAFTEKEIKARYKNAVLGFLWLFLNPLLQMAVIGFVFSSIFRFGIQDYYLFLFTGLLPWSFFSLSLNKATPSIVYERNLIQKSAFPREIIPLSIVLSNFFHLLISLGLLLIFLGVTGRWQVFLPFNLFLFSVGLFFLAVFTAGLTLLTANLNVFWRDITFFTQALLLIWFYATPILYPFSFLPESYQKIFYLNPLSGIFSIFQQVILGQENFPSAILIYQFLGITFILVLSIIIFRNSSKYFADWV